MTSLWYISENICARRQSVLWASSVNDTRLEGQISIFETVQKGANKYLKLQPYLPCKESFYGNSSYLTMQSVFLRSNVRHTLEFPECYNQVRRSTNLWIIVHIDVIWFTPLVVVFPCLFGERLTWQGLCTPSLYSPRNLIMTAL